LIINTSPQGQNPGLWGINGEIPGEGFNQPDKKSLAIFYPDKI
jgi:hypothetical protein